MERGNSHIPVFFDIETTGLNPLAQAWHNKQKYDAQVTAIGVGYFDDYDGDERQRVIKVEYGPNEYKLLSDLRDRMHKIEAEISASGVEPIVVGFNSRQYDHPYLVARYSRLRQNPYPFCHEWKRLDMMRALRKRDGKYWNQDDYARHIGVHTEDEFDGSDMPEAFDKRQWRKILDHVRADMEDMMDIFTHDLSDFMNHFYDHYGIDKDMVVLDDEEL